MPDLTQGERDRADKLDQPGEGGQQECQQEEENKRWVVLIFSMTHTHSIHSILRNGVRTYRNYMVYQLNSLPRQAGGVWNYWWYADRRGSQLR